MRYSTLRHQSPVWDRTCITAYLHFYGQTRRHKMNIHAAETLANGHGRRTTRPTGIGRGLDRTEAGIGLQDNQLDGIAKSDIQQRAGGVSEFTGNALGGVAEQPGQRNDGDRVHAKDDAGAGMNLGHDDADGHKDEQQIDLAVEQDHPTGPGKPEQQAGFAVGGLVIVALVVLAVVYDRPLGCSFRCRLIDLASIMTRWGHDGWSGRAIAVATWAVTVVRSIMVLCFYVDVLKARRLRFRLCVMETTKLMRVYGFSTACASVWRLAAMRSGPEAEAICKG